MAAIAVMRRASTGFRRYRRNGSRIEDGKLILQHNKKAFDLFNKELKANVTKADANWPAWWKRMGSRAASRW